MSNKDGMRRLREARRSAGFREVTVWVPANCVKKTMDSARELLVRAAKEGTPLPGDEALAKIAEEMTDSSLVSLWSEACRDAGCVVEPWRLGFSDAESAKLQSAWASAAHAEYLTWREAYLRQRPEANGEEIEKAYQQQIKDVRSLNLEVVSSDLRRARRESISRTSETHPDLNR